MGTLTMSIQNREFCEFNILESMIIHLDKRSVRLATSNSVWCFVYWKKQRNSLAQEQSRSKWVRSVPLDCIVTSTCRI
jgi:hypothetical protein